MAPSDNLVNYLRMLTLTFRMQKQNMSELQCPWLSSVPRYLAVFYCRASKKKSKTEKNDLDKCVSLLHTVYGLRMEQEETIKLI